MTTEVATFRSRVDVAMNQLRQAMTKSIVENRGQNASTDMSCIDAHNEVVVAATEAQVLVTEMARVLKMEMNTTAKRNAATGHEC